MSSAFIATNSLVNVYDWQSSCHSSFSVHRVTLQLQVQRYSRTRRHRYGTRSAVRQCVQYPSLPEVVVL
jgi:hypothetical protein